MPFQNFLEKYGCLSGNLTGFIVIPSITLIYLKFTLFWIRLTRQTKKKLLNKRTVYPKLWRLCHISSKSTSIFTSNASVITFSPYVDKELVIQICRMENWIFLSCVSIAQKTSYVITESFFNKPLGVMNM